MNAKVTTKVQESAPKGATGVDSRVKTDWEAVERDYRAGILSYAEMGKVHGVTKGRICIVAKKNGWTRAVLMVAAKATDRADDKTKPGFVYVLRMLDTAGKAFYKIGMALNSEQRTSSHQGSSPFKLEIAVSYYVGNMRREESILHFMFDAQNVRGEWFTLSDGDLDTIALRARLV